MGNNNLLIKSKPIKLEYGIVLEIREGATLLFNPDFYDYKPFFTRLGETKCHGLGAMIFADSFENINISGNGVIDGQDSVWWWLQRTTEKQCIWSEFRVSG
jgi:polygalacturonase